VLANTHVIDRHVIRSCFDIDRELLQRAQISALDQSALHDLKTNERLYLEKLMEACAGDKEQVAKLANISLRSLYRKLAADTSTVDDGPAVGM
jgi:transcriptional regulator with PAS, ATPase and Fis domain